MPVNKRATSGNMQWCGTTSWSWLWTRVFIIDCVEESRSCCVHLRVLPKFCCQKLKALLQKIKISWDGIQLVNHYWHFRWAYCLRAVGYTCYVRNLTTASNMMPHYFLFTAHDVTVGLVKLFCYITEWSEKGWLCLNIRWHKLQYTGHHPVSHPKRISTSTLSVHLHIYCISL
jgi:hypothetical protein